jgi:aspartate beta-hydroxylase
MNPALQQQMAGLRAQLEQASRQGQTGAALKLADALLKLDANEPAARHTYGLEALRGNRLSEAEAHFRVACQSSSANALMFANLARVLKMKGEYRAALVELGQAIKLDVGAWGAYFERGDIYQQLGEFKNAALSYGQALSAMPEALRQSPQFKERVELASHMVRQDREQLARVLLQRVDAVRSGLCPRDARRINETLAIALGQTRHYPSKPLMFHITRLPSIPFFEREDFAWAAAVESATDAIRAELLAVFSEDAEGFEPYVQTEAGESPGQFKALDHNPDWGAYFLWKHGQRIDAHCARCPNTLDILALVPQIAIKQRAPAVLFSSLKPHTHIPAHNGATNARLTVHLPLIVPPNCQFRVGAELREWREGELLLFDDTIEHEAHNRSDQRRTVLIFDIWHPMLSGAEREMVSGILESMIDYYGADAPLGEL